MATEHSERGVAFGDMLKRLRKAAGLTQEELAERAHLSRNAINALERGARQSPRKDTVALLATALALSDEQHSALLGASRLHRLLAAPTGPDAVIASPLSIPSAPSARPAPFATDPPADLSRPQVLAARPHNLPAPLNELVGREREVEDICALLRQNDVRLVTLTGPGGIGKTRVSLQAAAELLDTLSDGVWCVRLSRLSDPELVLPSIAQCFDLRESGGMPLAEMVGRYLREKELLLVLDNFEQVVVAAPAIGTLLESCPGLKILVTSRMALHLRGEHEYALRPLALPDPDQLPPPERVAQYAAVALFIQRAQAAQADFQVTNATAGAVAKICARLDGLPLAIELAAARVRVLPPPALLQRLERRLPLLVGGPRDVEERQQTMRNTLAWSNELLQPEEQMLFRRLAVFVGGCTLEAAEAVCAAPEGAAPLRLDLLEGLSRLVDQSLVQQSGEESGGEPRFGLLQVIREYALEQLEASGEGEALRRAHAAAMMALAERAEPELTGPEAGVWLERMEREHDNLRAALGWAVERGEQGEVETGLRLAAALGRFWEARGHLREGRVWLEGLLAPGAGSETVRARALFAGGVLAMWQGDVAAAGSWLEQATALARATGDRRTAAVVLNGLGTIGLLQGDLEWAGARYADSLALMRETGDQRGIAVALLNLGEAALYQGDLERADAALSEGLALFRQLGDRASIAVGMANLGTVARKRGGGTEAVALGREALALYRELGDQPQCAEGLEQLAKTLGAAGQGERAARLLGAAASLRGTLGAPLPAHERADIEQATAAARVTLGEEAWEAAFAAGRALSLEEAIAEALGEQRGDAAGGAC
jgi:predicted ATPase/transcriptional regulator with XRE-family HTH domain